MPKVKGMKFPYTEEGVKEAKKYQNSLSMEKKLLKMPNLIINLFLI